MPNVDVQGFRSGFRGHVFEPSDAGYDKARRIWNASVDKHPRVIASCSGVADVMTAVDFARASELITAIRGGGHNVGGRALCDDGVVIDLSDMRAVYVDSANARSECRVGPLLAIWTAKLMSSVLPCPAELSEDGDRGFDTGRRRGLADAETRNEIDNLLSCQIVTAESRVLTVSAFEHDDLSGSARRSGQLRRCLPRSSFGHTRFTPFSAVSFHTLVRPQWMCSVTFAILWNQLPTN